MDNCVLNTLTCCSKGDARMPRGDASSPISPQPAPGDCISRDSRCSDRVGLAVEAHHGCTPKFGTINSEQDESAATSSKSVSEVEQRING